MFRKRGTATKEKPETVMPITPAEARAAQQAAKDAVLAGAQPLFEELDRQLEEKSFARVAIRDYSSTALAAAKEAYQAAGWSVDEGWPDQREPDITATLYVRER